MATKIRRLIQSIGWLIVGIVVCLPVIGIAIGLWPQKSISWSDLVSFVQFTGLAESILSSLLLALIAPLVALYVAFMVYSQFRFRRSWQSLERRLAPLLSLPHLAVALGLVYLFAGGGLLYEALGNVIGQTLSSDFGLARKSLLTMIIAISLKEIPFFLLVFSAVGRQLPIQNWILQGQALGYRQTTCWWLLVFPSVVKQSRLALLAAMAYTVSVVDVSLLVGPNIPQLFAVQLYDWQSGFSPLQQTYGFIGNIVLLLMLGLLIASIYLHEFLIVVRLRRSGILAAPLRLTRASRLFVVWPAFFSLLSLAILATFLLWSLGIGMSSGGLSSAGFNSSGFDLSQLSFALWQEEWFFVQQPLFTSLLIAVISSISGIVIALLALELQRINHLWLPDYIWLLAILLPQLSMVYGWQIAHTTLGADYHWWWVTLAHLPFTFAYSYLVLRGPFQSLNRHYDLLAASFGYGYWQRWWLIRIALLRPALLIAGPIAFSVSIAQYIPTLMIGAGRVATITTEAVAVASGNQKDITSVYMLLQSALPFVVFLIASLVLQRSRGSFDAKNH